MSSSPCLSVGCVYYNCYHSFPLKSTLLMGLGCKEQFCFPLAGFCCHLLTLSATVLWIITSHNTYYVSSMTVSEKGELNKCNSMWKSYFVTKWLTNEDDVHRYFVLKYCLKGILHVNTDVVKKKKDIELLRVFKMSVIGHKEWIDGVYWSKYTTCFSVFGQQPCPVCLSEKITCQIVVVLAGMYCWATVAQISLTDVSPIVFFLLLLLSFRGGSVCLSWLLEPSLSIKKKIFCYLFLTHVKNTMGLSSDSLVLQHQKDVCYCIYHQAFCLYQLFFFSALWGT